MARDNFPGSIIKSQVFVDFPNGNKPLLTKFASEVKEYQDQIYKNRLLLSKFLSMLRQYYVNAPHLNNEFDELLTYMNMTYILTLKITNVNDMEEFIKLVDLYNNAGTRLFHLMVKFDVKLSTEEISLKKKKKDFVYLEEHFKYVRKPKY